MGFRRTAYAVNVKNNVTERGWSRIRTAGKTVASRNLLAQATEILGEPFDPSKFLLTHSTIVASVDVESPSGVKLGRVQEGKQKINRKYSDFYITPGTSQYVNNNGDCWSRSTLLKAYQTFIGSHNFQEHVQIEELSKGRIIDAVARDIGDSVYVDILVATDRRHQQLVADIESGNLGTLSMGCSVDFTVCSKCGNVAVDETQLCDHIRHFKRDSFYDEKGQRRIIAELCGHPSVDPTGGVTFIEASWVQTPAFTGAVLRNILEPSEISARTAAKANEILSRPPKEWSLDGETALKVATVQAEDFNFGDPAEDPGGDDQGSKAPKEPSKSPMEEIEDDIAQTVLDKVQKRLRDDVQKEQTRKVVQDSTSPNDNVIKQAQREVQAAYSAASAELVRTASCDADLINKVAQLDDAFGVQVERDLYRASLRVGATRRYPNVRAYLDAFQRELGRTATPLEAKAMLRLGKALFDLEQRHISPAGDK